MIISLSLTIVISHSLTHALSLTLSHSLNSLTLSHSHTHTRSLARTHTHARSPARQPSTGSLRGSFKMVTGTRAGPLGPTFDVDIPLVRFLVDSDATLEAAQLET